MSSDIFIAEMTVLGKVVEYCPCERRIRGCQYTRRRNGVEQSPALVQEIVGSKKLNDRFLKGAFYKMSRVQKLRCDEAISLAVN